MERIGYIILGFVACCWIVAMIAGMIVTFPVGIIGLLAIIGLGFLFVRALADRLNTKKDDKYSNTIEQ